MRGDHELLCTYAAYHQIAIEWLMSRRALPGRYSHLTIIYRDNRQFQNYRYVRSKLMCHVAEAWHISCYVPEKAVLPVQSFSIPVGSSVIHP